MFARASAGQDENRGFAFKYAAIKFQLEITEDAVARLKFVVAVEHRCLGIQESCLKALRFDFTLLRLREQDIQHHPTSDDAKRLFSEGTNGELDQLIVPKT
ncbi:hypothetical protein D3C86_1900570 [compost metagenome]